MDILDGPLVFVDIETDGMNHQRGHVIEVAVIRVENSRVVQEYQTLVDPGVEIPYFITNLTGIQSGDLRGAPTFQKIAKELFDILDGALFVAHNVRFDYSFLKQEFKRVGVDFSPKQLCTVRLSRALFPEQKSHKLASLIERHNFSFTDRHRAYDDAHVLWQFVQLVKKRFALHEISAAIAKQLKHPSLPKHLDRTIIENLPETHGVYFFEDEQGYPLYIGKSVNIKRRVMSHFTRDSEEYKEFKMAQLVHNVSFMVTSGEMEALLLESHLIKSKQPLYNRRLRRTHKLVVIKQEVDENGYMYLVTETLEQLATDTLGDILGTYTTRMQAKEAILEAVRSFQLCAKLCGLEKSKATCFNYQLGKCKGACIGGEDPETYNQRLLLAFANKRLINWPYAHPILVQETSQPDFMSGFVVNDWRILGRLTQESDCEPVFTPQETTFDLDAYKILKSFLANPAKKLLIKPITFDTLQAF